MSILEEALEHKRSKVMSNSKHPLWEEFQSYKRSKSKRYKFAGILTGGGNIDSENWVVPKDGLMKSHKKMVRGGRFFGPEFLKEYAWRRITVELVFNEKGPEYGPFVGPYIEILNVKDIILLDK